MESCKRSEHGELTPGGYYRLRDPIGGQRLVHRIVYERYHRVNLTPDQFVLHSCNNSWCVEPTHLRVGNHQDNMDDVVKFGTRKGSKHNGAKLTEEDIPKIREFAKSYTHQVIADWYGVTQQTITLIINRRTWRHVK